MRRCQHPPTALSAQRLATLGVGNPAALDGEGAGGGEPVGEGDWVIAAVKDEQRATSWSVENERNSNIRADLEACTGKRAGT